MRTSIHNFILFLFRLPATLLLIVFAIFSYTFVGIKYYSNEARKKELFATTSENVQHFFINYNIETELICFAFWNILSHILIK